jgi:hypothetical protein
MFHDRSQTVIADPLAVHTGHIIACVPHDRVHCHLVARIAADGLKGMP